MPPPNRMPCAKSDTATDWDEHLAYFLILSQLLNEADAQLEADSDEPATLIYADDLETLRDALGAAMDAASSIIERVQTQRASQAARVLAESRPARVTH